MFSLVKDPSFPEIWLLGSTQKKIWQKMKEIILVQIAYKEPISPPPNNRNSLCIFTRIYPNYPIQH